MEVTIGLFAGIFEENGKLLLRRRERERLGVPCEHEGDWELPGGTMEESLWKANDETIVAEELAREVREETGLSIKIPLMPAMYPAIYINKKEKKIDFAFVVPIGIMRERPASGKTVYVSPTELKDLAERPEGERLVSGWGKRMCRMALTALRYSPNRQYAKEADIALQEVQNRFLDSSS